MRLGKIHHWQWIEGAMSKAARSVFFFSIYLLVMGAVLTVAPNLLLVVFGLPTTTSSKLGATVRTAPITNR